jgi:hypothetical protein
VQKGIAFTGRQVKMVGQQFRQLARGLASINFDLLDGRERAADTLGKLVLSQV